MLQLTSAYISEGTNIILSLGSRCEDSFNVMIAYAMQARIKKKGCVIRLYFFLPSYHHGVHNTGQQEV